VVEDIEQKESCGDRMRLKTLFRAKYANKTIDHGRDRVSMRMGSAGSPVNYI
jgi:hypothetical protein